ncbi:MAG: TonB-dependent receptor plug domain-containing protein, partial [Bacteroidales bacterium]|nr:TonB-dependent receptor plug domain-containing protein [Bacteroidales bacterium]
MKRLYAYIIVPLLFIGSFASAQEETGLSQMDSIVISNPFRIRAAQNAVKNADVFDKSPEVDIAKALYGQFSGLLVKQGTGRSEENQSKLRLHGHSPLIVIDGFPRDISDVTGVEIESVQILKDAASAALYGVRGGNGVVLITTKRGKATPLKVTAKYQYGMAKMFRAPEFADAYTYGYFMNQARELDGLAAKYTQNELYALYTGGYPYAYPNVNWWDQVYRSHGDNHRAQFTFNGGNRNFRYFAAIDYMKDDALYVKPTADDRYNAKVYDNRLGLRANVDVNLTETTSMKLGVMARLSEFNTPNWSTRIENILYYLPAAAFPIKQEDGTYGGSSIYGANNPVAIMNETGNHQYSQTKVLANMVLRQDLNSVLQGLSADASIAFDYLGKMTEVSSKEYRYSELVGRVYMNGVNTMIRTEQK